MSNTATVTVPAGVTDSNPANNSATDTDTVNAVADLAITKTDAVASVNAGASTVYTITVTNNGPSSVTGAILTDSAVAGLTKTAVVCSATPGQCVTAPTILQLEGGAFALPALASGQTYQITVTASVTASSGSVSNTATVTVPAGVTDSNPANNSATDTDTVNAGAGMISGSVWYDLNYNNIRDGSEIGRVGWPVQLMSGSSVISTATTDSGGYYAFTGLANGIYTVRFIDPNGQVLTHGPLPVNGDGGSTVTGGGSATLSQLSGITLGGAITSVPGQSLPVDPSGVVYNSVTRLSISGALVTLGGPPGFNPAIDLAGGTATVTTGVDGAYAFFLLPAAPAGTYTLTVSRAGFSFVSSVIPPTPVPVGFSGGNVSGQAVAGPPTGATSTTYYLSFPLPATDIINNNIPLDSTAVASSAAAIPTLSEWGLILLSGFVGLFAFFRLRRQRA